jgi:PhnB protein
MAKFRPEGWHTLTPRVFVSDPEGFVAFLRTVFDAEGEFKSGSPAEMRIGDSLLMVSEVGPRELTTAFLYAYVEDADATYRQAIAAGAASLEAPLDTPYGDRRAMVEDRWGNTWQIATYRPRSS